MASVRKWWQDTTAPPSGCLRSLTASWLVSSSPCICHRTTVRWPESQNIRQKWDGDGEAYSLVWSHSLRSLSLCVQYERQRCLKNMGNISTKQEYCHLEVRYSSFKYPAFCLKGLLLIYLFFFLSCVVIGFLCVQMVLGYFKKRSNHFCSWDCFDTYSFSYSHRQALICAMVVKTLSVSSVSQFSEMVKQCFGCLRT